MLVPNGGVAAAQGKNLRFLGYFRENPEVFEVREEQQHPQVSGDRGESQTGAAGAGNLLSIPGSLAELLVL